MSKELRELISLSNNLAPHLKSFFEMYQKIEGTSAPSRLNTDERYQFQMFFEAAEKAEDTYYLLQQMNKPVKLKGRLKKNANGRYEAGGYEFSTGAPLEVWYEEDDEPGYFVPSRIEHNGLDYYIVFLGRTTNIEHVLVRLK